MNCSFLSPHNQNDRSTSLFYPPPMHDNVVRVGVGVGVRVRVTVSIAVRVSGWAWGKCTWGKKLPTSSPSIGLLLDVFLTL